MSADGTTLDGILEGRITLRQPQRGHRVGHDAILLAAFASRQARQVVDLGCGVGSAGLAFLTCVPQARGVLVEIDPALAALAAENVARNGLAGRCAVVAADVTTLARPGGPTAPAPESADLVLMNPPFNPAPRHQASPRADKARAHLEGAGALQAWVKAAYRCLEPGGQLCLIHRPAALAAILEALAGRFGAVELLPVHPAPGAPAVRLLARAIKGRRTDPALLSGLVLAAPDGTPTPEASAVLRQASALP